MSSAEPQEKRLEDERGRGPSVKCCANENAGVLTPQERKQQSLFASFEHPPGSMPQTG